MICPFCGHALNLLTEVLALTQTGTQCRIVGTTCRKGAARQQIRRLERSCHWSRRRTVTGFQRGERHVQVNEKASHQIRKALVPTSEILGFSSKSP